MTRHMCAVLSVLTLASINARTAATIDSQRRPDFSGTYTLLQDRSVAIEQGVFSVTSPPDSISGPTVVGACGNEFTIAQTDKLLTIRVVSGQTAARRYNGPSVDGTYEFDHSAITSSSGYTASLRQRDAALELRLTHYNDRTLPRRFQYVFRSGKDDTLTVEYLTNSSAYDVLNNSPYRRVTSVYQKSKP